MTKTLDKHKADGTYRADRHGDYEPPEGRPVPPVSLSDAAHDLFVELAEVLTADGAVCPHDSHSLAELCELSIEIASLRDDISENGYTYMTEKGNEVQRAVVGVLNQKTGHYIKLLQQFGLTPKGRVGLRSTKPASDPLAERLKSRGVSIG